MALVNLKGTASGIILELDPNVSFDVLIKEIADKFRESKSFLGKASMGLIIRGRTILDEEENDILDAISNNSNIYVSCVLRDDPDTEKIFAGFVEQPENGEEADKTDGEEADAEETVAKESDEGEAGAKEADSKEADAKEGDANEAVSEEADKAAVEDEKPEVKKSINEIKEQATIFYGSVRSGQVMTFEKSVILMGDVKAGGTIVSNGCIFVMGALKGEAHAGAAGDSDAFVLALEFDPLQVRIADKFAINSKSGATPRLRLKGFKKSTPEKKTEVAYIFDDHIIKDVYGSAFLRDNRFV